MHELVSSAGEIKITPELQYMPGQDTVRRTFQINFGQVYLAKPTAREKDGYDALVYGRGGGRLYIFCPFVWC